MYISGIKFFVTVSKGIHLITSEYLHMRCKGNLKDAIVRAIKLYHNKGVHVVTALGNGEFDPLRNELGATDLNPTAAAEHAPEIESG